MLNLINELFIVNLEQGLILALLALGMAIPFKLLNFPDLTAEGSYALSACLYVVLINSGLGTVSTMIIAVLAAGIAGLCTAIIYIRYHINSILAGIIVSTMIYSINLRAMGKPNLPMTDNFLSTILHNLHYNIIFMSALTILIIYGIVMFLRTEKGLVMRAVGFNPNFARRQAISVNLYIIAGVFLGNSLAGLAGVLLAQTNHYADVSMSLGIAVQGLAALMIGEKVIGSNSIVKIVISPIIGALIYQQIQGIVLLMGLAPSDLKFVTGMIIIGVISL